MLKPLARYEQDVIVIQRTETGRDDHNFPVYEYTETLVSGVLVVPKEPQALPVGEVSSTRQEGHLGRIDVYIPETCTLNFENSKLKIKEPNGDWAVWKVIGLPTRINKATTTRFNLYLICERETG